MTKAPKVTAPENKALATELGNWTDEERDFAERIGDLESPYDKTLLLARCLLRIERLEARAQYWRSNEQIEKLTRERDELKAEHLRLSYAHEELKRGIADSERLRLAAEAVVPALRTLLAKSENYFEEHGAEHGSYAEPDGGEYDCPEDDTCECPLVVELNKACSFAMLKLAAYDAAIEQKEAE